MDLYHLYEDKADSPYDVWKHIHTIYNNTVKAVAKAEQVELLDLEQDFNTRQDAFITKGLPFYNDGIHFTPIGEQEMAILFARQLVLSNEQEKLSNYIFSTSYYYTNAIRFVNTFALNAANYYIQQIETKDHFIPAEDIQALRTSITNELPFYNAYFNARIAKGNAHDKMETRAMFLHCINLRPDDQELRINSAQDLADLGFFEDTLSVLANRPEPYIPENKNRALWLAFNTCQTAGFISEAYQYLSEIRHAFPDDQRADFYYHQLYEPIDQ